jgi:hypothetical protein
MPPASTPPVAFRLRRPYANDDEFLAGDGHAIFRSGMVLIGAGPRPAGLIVRFELALRDGSSLFRGEGKVVAHRQDPEDGKPQGLEIRFTRLDARGKVLVDRLIRSREPLPGESEPLPESVAFDALPGPASIIPPLDHPPDLVIPAAAGVPTFELATPLTPASAPPPANHVTFELATPLTPPALSPSSPIWASSPPLPPLPPPLPVLDPLDSPEFLLVAATTSVAPALPASTSLPDVSGPLDGVTLSPPDLDPPEPPLVLEAADITMLVADTEILPEASEPGAEAKAAEPASPEPASPESAPPTERLLVEVEGGSAELERLRRRPSQGIYVDAGEREALLGRLRSRFSPVDR